MADLAPCNPEAQSRLADGADDQSGDANPHHPHHTPAKSVEGNTINEQVTAASISGDGEENHGDSNRLDGPPRGHSNANAALPLAATRESSGDSLSVAGAASSLAARSSDRAWSNTSSRLTSSDHEDDFDRGGDHFEVLFAFLDNDKEGLPSRLLNRSYASTTRENRYQVAIMAVDDAGVSGTIPPAYLYPTEIAREDLL
ncbi:hypothetical protein QBC41DRAFT_226066 [Cercophora samala]|uniref:Uncharacterized protein n=1 Tax=Cercophora samala TaxID=330535 RepID=A0AA39ZDH4_9PEZI|nr:hypothetical protein QBC41DRAFT_226066 [Cercophora samala]